MSAPTFFDSPAAFRAWLQENHAVASEILVGYWKKATGKPSVTWEETVDEALCFGWIDGVRKRIDDESFTVRFTPRREGSIWSQRNLDRIQALQAVGRMQSAGLAAWKARRPDRSGYSSETRIDSLPPAMEQRFGTALAFHMDQPPGYRTAITNWVMSAKQQATKDRRLEAVIASARKGVRVDLAKPFVHLED